VDRNIGNSRWFHIENTRTADTHPIVTANISKEARLMTGGPDVPQERWQFGKHGTTTHALVSMWI
jgi:hypothetical protein